MRSPARSPRAALALVLLSSLAGCGGPAGDGPDAAAPRNLLIVTLDTVRQDHLSVYGGPATVPNLERLAAEGARFDSAFTTTPLTLPSHASLFTGLGPIAHGVHNNGTFRLTDAARTLAEVLAEQGFRTAAVIGAQVLDSRYGLDQGFELYDDLLPPEEQVRTLFVERPASQVVDAGIAWLQERQDERWFLWLHLFDPHYPYAPPIDYMTRFLPPGHSPTTKLPRTISGPLSPEHGLTAEQILEFEARYDAEIAFADAHVGKLLGLLSKHGLLERSLLIVTADHGETLSERPEWAFDHGGRVFEEQVAIPLIVHLPEDRDAGRREPAFAHHVDLVPTILDALGLAVPRQLPGHSLLPVLARPPKPAEPRPLYMHARPTPSRTGLDGVELGRAGLITALRLGDLKLIEYPLEAGGEHPLLFDLASDPGEHHDVGARRKDERATLQELLERFRAETGLQTRIAVPRFDQEAQRRLRALGYVE